MDKIRKSPCSFETNQDSVDRGFQHYYFIEKRTSLLDLTYLV